MVVMLTFQGKNQPLRAKSAQHSGKLPQTKGHLVNDLKVRPNQPQGSNFAFKVRSSKKLHGWNRFWSRTFDVKDENLYYFSSPKKYHVALIDTSHWKCCQTFRAK